MQCNVIYAGNSSSRFSGGQHRPLCLALQWIQCSLPSEYQRPERRVILVIFRSWSFLWLKQCHFRHPMTRNGLYMFYTTYKHGDDWKMVYKVYDLWLFYPHDSQTDFSSDIFAHFTLHTVRTLAGCRSLARDFSVPAMGQQWRPTPAMTIYGNPQ